MSSPEGDRAYFPAQLLRNERHEKAYKDAGTPLNVTMRLQGHNPMTREEEARIRQYADSEQDDQLGVWRQQDTAPPLDKKRPFSAQDGGGYHRRPWSGPELVQRTWPVIAKLKRQISHLETEARRNLVSKIQKKGKKATPLEVLLLQRCAVVSIDCDSRQRSLLLSLIDTLDRSKVPEYMYKDEVQALIGLENIKLTEREFAYKAGAPVPEATKADDKDLMLRLTRQAERYNICRERKKRRSDAYFAGAPRDPFGEFSAAEWVRAHRNAFPSFRKDNSQNQNNNQRNNRSNNRGRGRGRGGRGRGRGSKRKRNSKGQGNTNGRGKGKGQPNPSSTAATRSE